MARAGLRWGVRELAAEAGVDPATIVRLESGLKVLGSTAAKIERALLAAGVEFLENGGVRVGGTREAEGGSRPATPRTGPGAPSDDAPVKTPDARHRGMVWYR